ncbi:hypothetical protein [Methanoregula sp.]|uniref:hypothetical protein n=1 Tax=Methanoregula sp. TaxID=2052170 RepID=UPI002C48F34C|nr:hypothetical protein [Methanoregula sp.]HVP96377.1 hypothetical protein [Methanoregula sp.]
MGYCRIPGGKGIVRALLPVILIALLCGPVLALPLPPAHGGAAQFSQGIPVYWPYHAGLMLTGFILLLTGFLVARYHKTGNWYRSHAILQTCGASCIIAGIAVGVYMVALSGFPPLRNIHEILGVTTGLLVVLTLVVGYSIRRVKTAKGGVRTGHRWLGRIAICLMVVTIIFGIYFLSLLLGR